MLDLSKPEHRDILLKVGVSEDKIKKMHEKQMKGERLSSWIKTEKGLIRMPESLEEVEKRNKLKESRKHRVLNSEEREEYNRRKVMERSRRDEKLKQENPEKYEEVLIERRKRQRENYRKRQNADPEHRKLSDDRRARKKGYTDFNELRRENRHLKGEQLAMDENKKCSSYLGVYIMEKKVASEVLCMMFENVMMMPYSNPKHDAICKNARKEFVDRYPHFELKENTEYKIQVKSSSVIQNNHCSTSYFSFGIRKNNLADYFLLFAVGNRESLNISHIWMINRDSRVSYVDGRLRKSLCVGKLVNLKIANSIKGLYRIEKYKLDEEFLRRANDICKV